MAPLVEQELVEQELEEDMDLDIIMDEALEVLGPNISEVELARAVVILKEPVVVKREEVTKRKTSKRVEVTSIMQVTSQAVDRREKRVIKCMRLMIRAMLGRRAVRYRKVFTVTRQVRRKVTTIKRNNMANIIKGLKATREQVMARKAVTRRDIRLLVTTTCIIRTNSRRSIPSTMTLTRVDMKTNMAGTKNNNQLLREVMRREAMLMPLIMKVNMERRDSTRRDSTRKKKRDIRVEKVIKDITIIMKIMPKRVAIAKDLLMAIVVVTVTSEGTTVAMVVGTAITELPQYRISRVCTQIYPNMHMESKCSVCICLTMIISIWYSQYITI
jgi:hypothetical protein